jgi:alpha-L-arabinofuranosidase
MNWPATRTEGEPSHRVPSECSVPFGPDSTIPNTRGTRNDVVAALKALKVDSVNTFDAPNTVVPKSVSAKLQGGKLALKLEPKSVTVISVE